MQARAGHAGRATCTHQTTAHPYRRQLPDDSCIVLSVCCAALCCAVMWLQPASALPIFSTGRASLAADPVSHVTQHLFLLRRPFLPCSPSPSQPLSAWLVSISHRSSGKVRASLLWPQMSSFNNGRLSEKGPANRAPQYPSRLPAAGRAGCDRNLDEPRDPPRRWALRFELDIASMPMPLPMPCPLLPSVRDHQHHTPTGHDD